MSEIVTFCIDPGHSKGQNRSPIAPEYIEGERMFLLGHLLKKELERYKNAKVLITREKVTENPSLYDRGMMAKGCKVLLSLHSDAAPDGAENVDRATVFHPISGKGADLARLLADKIAATMEVKQGGRVKTRVNGAGDADYYGVIRYAVRAGSVGMILEHSFHTNRRSAEWLLDDSNLEKLAKAEAEVLADYYGLKKKPGEEDEVRYKYLKDVPKAYREETIDRLVRLGIIKGKGGEGENLEIDLGEDAIRLLIYNDRAGLYPLV